MNGVDNMEIIRKNLGIYGANSYIIFNDKNAIVIDCGGDADTIVKILNERNLKLEAILLTHGHFDHIGGVGELRKLTGAKVYGAELERDLFEDANHNLSNGTLLGEIILKCDNFFKGGDILEFDAIKLEVVASPGHTEGGVVFYSKEANALFTGDTLFSRSVGRTDLYSGNQEKLESSLIMIAKDFDDGTTIYPGHGPESSIGYEKANNQYITTLLNR